MRVDKVKVFSSPVVCLCTFNDQSLIVLALTIPRKCNRKDTSTPTGQIIAVNANSYYENVKTLLKKERIFVHELTDGAHISRC